MTVYYTEDHEWIDVDGNVATIGITAHAAEQLGEVVYIELKEPGEGFKKADEIGVVESVKAASEIYAPVTGEITAANTVLNDEPAKLNEAPEGDAWLYKITLSNADELKDLMDADAYKAMIG